jgi:hypothetical protein
MGGIPPRHTCSARCGARRRYELRGWDRCRACPPRSSMASFLGLLAAADRAIRACDCGCAMRRSELRDVNQSQPVLIRRHLLLRKPHERSEARSDDGGS